MIKVIATNTFYALLIVLMVIIVILVCLLLFDIVLDSIFKIDLGDALKDWHEKRKKREAMKKAVKELQKYTYPKYTYPNPPKGTKGVDA